jgi:hypothetical protein
MLQFCKLFSFLESTGYFNECLKKAELTDDNDWKSMIIEIDGPIFVVCFYYCHDSVSSVEELNRKSVEDLRFSRR